MKFIKGQKRQGDVLVENTVKEVPSQAKAAPEDPRGVVLAEGEATGHYHGLGGSRINLFRFDDTQLTSYVTIEGVPAQLKHQEHAEIVVSPGTIEVTIQRQWTLGRMKRVVD